MRFVIVLIGVAWAQFADAQGMQWPLPGQGRDIAHAFGQFQEYRGRRYLHEGIDIPAPQGTVANFHGNGRVHNFVRDLQTPAQSYVEIMEGNRLWRYLHVTPKQGIAVGQAIGGAQPRVGTLAAFTDPIAPHLHLEVVIGGLRDDPLLHLADVAQKQPPAKPSELLFRLSNGARNYKTATCTGRRVVTADVDIVAKAADKFLGGDSNTSVHALTLEVQRDGAALIKETPFRFGAGVRNIGFAAGDSGEDLLPVFYADDAHANTRDLDNAATLFGRHDFYYFLTNIGDDRNVIAPVDANKYWNTKVRESANTAWNTPGQEAPDNARARFHDHLYAVVVSSVDENGKVSDPTRSDVFVNNFDERLVIGNAQLQPQQEFQQGAQIFVGGDGYPKARRYDVHLMSGPNLDLTNCSGLSGQIVANVATDNNGRIPATLINLPAPGQAGHPAFYRLVLDFDADGKYTPRREGRVVDVVSESFTVGQ